MPLRARSPVAEREPDVSAARAALVRFADLLLEA